VSEKQEVLENCEGTGQPMAGLLDAWSWGVGVTGRGKTRGLWGDWWEGRRQSRFEII
jgi:hypothetical protein